MAGRLSGAMIVQPPRNGTSSLRLSRRIPRMVAWRSPGVPVRSRDVVAPSGSAGAKTTSMPPLPPCCQNSARMPELLRVKRTFTVPVPNGMLSTATESHSGGRCGASMNRRAGASTSTPRRPRISGVNTMEVAKNCCGTAVSSGL